MEKILSTDSEGKEELAYLEVRYALSLFVCTLHIPYCYLTYSDERY